MLTLYVFVPHYLQIYSESCADANNVSLGKLSAMARFRLVLRVMRHIASFEKSYC